MYIYRIQLQSSDQFDINPVKPMNNILNNWSDRYTEVIGFCKLNALPILVPDLRDLELEKLRGYSLVVIQLNGVPKTLSSKIKSVEKVEL